MNCEFELQIVIFGLNVQRYDFFLIYARAVVGRKLERGAILFPYCSLLPTCGVFVGYSWGIHRIFICIGYVSVMYRLYVEANEAQMGAKIRSEK